MSKKQSYIFCAIVLAVASIIAGLCFVFLGNQAVKGAPDLIKVENIDDDFYLVADYKDGYEYYFKLEQFIDGEYVVVADVKSETNLLNLSEQELNIVAGQKYRFSACYFYENSKGEYGETLSDWQPSWALQTINYQNVSYDYSTETLSWNEIYLADGYTVRLVDSGATVFEKQVSSTSVSLSDVGAGNYRVYIFANSENSYLLDSFAGVGKDISIIRKNVVLQAERGVSNELTVVCAYATESFEIYVDGVFNCSLITTAGQNVAGGVKYGFNSTNILFGQLDFDNVIVQIKTTASDCILESELKNIN